MLIHESETKEGPDLGLVGRADCCSHSYSMTLAPTSHELIPAGIGELSVRICLH